MDFPKGRSRDEKNQRNGILKSSVLKLKPQSYLKWSLQKTRASLKLLTSLINKAIWKIHKATIKVIYSSLDTMSEKPFQIIHSSVRKEINKFLTKNWLKICKLQCCAPIYTFPSRLSFDKNSTCPIQQTLLFTFHTTTCLTNCPNLNHSVTKKWV